MKSITVAKKNINKSNELHEGKMLEKLCLRSDKKLVDIAYSLGITYTWLHKIFKRDELPKKVKTKAIDYFQLPVNFFDVEMDKLPTQVNEPQVTYSDRGLVESLRKEIQEKNEKLLRLQDELIRVMQELSKMKEKS